MGKQVKRSPAERLREYQRKKYMGIQERSKDDADWRDGINQFRLRVQEELDEMKRKIGYTLIQQQNLLASLARLKAEFAKEENKLIEKYGEDARINMQTGEVTRVENPPIKEK